MTNFVCFRLLNPYWTLGSGKTLPIFMSISLYDNGTTTILILPLVAMHEEYKSRAKRHGLTCETWSNRSDVATAPQLLLVAVETCLWPGLQAHVETLIRLGRLARIVADEAHLLVKHESFRPCMGMLSFFGGLAASLVLMTATCPHHLEKELFQKLGRNMYQVVRRSTDRIEISQEMISIHACQPELEDAVAKNIISTTASFSDESERALLFCNSRDESERMAKLLGWKPYHSDVSIEERSHAMQSWKDGAVIGLACTSMLNCCLDYPSVRCVFHLGPPRDVIDYYQAIGRAARGGGVGKSILYFNPAFLGGASESDGSDPFGKQIIRDMLSDKSICRRLRPAFFLDGVGVPCSMLPNAQLCDVCTMQSNHPPQDSGVHRIPDHLAPAFPSRRLSIQALQPCRLGLLPDPQTEPAPTASFATHITAAAASLAYGGVGTDSDRRGHLIHVACNHLAKTCVNCWSNGLDFDSHSFPQCRWKPFDLQADKRWTNWVSGLRLPSGCCFFCGCPEKVRSF